MTFTQIRNTANYRRPILMCGKATWKTDGRLPQTTFYLPQTNSTWWESYSEDCKLPQT